MLSGLGPDIEEVYAELGTEIVIVNRTPQVSERILYEINAQGTKPFIREHHLDCTFPYNTSLVVGDVVYMPKTGRYHMVMNLTSELFEDEPVEVNGVIYLCNLPLTARILRPAEIRDVQSYDMISGWSVLVDAPVYGLITDRIFGSQLDELVIVGQTQIWRIDLYLPKRYNLEPLDRVVISDTEYYKVEAIEAYNFPGAVVATLVEDNRPMHDVIFDDEVYDD
jgi:hypothetical protein